MRKIMKSGSFELGTDGVGIDVTSHDDAITFYAPLTAEQRRDLADALVPGRDFSGVDWKAMYTQARSERDAAVYAYDKAERERDEWKARAGAAEARTAVTREDVTQAVRRGHNMFNAEVGVVNEMCDLFGIEAEQAEDPVEELAEQIESATRDAIRQVCDDLADVAPSLDPLAVEQAMEITAASRKVAAHVLGQEAKR